MSRSVGTAVIGLGSIGSVHADWYSRFRESNLVAVCDSRGRVAKQIGRKYGAKPYTDFRELLDDKRVEAVTIALPHHLHSRIAIATARAGKHLSVEKPLAITLKQADEMISAVKKAGVLDMYMENLCFAPSYKLAKDIIQNGGLGDLYLCKAYESNDYIVGSKAERETVEKSWYSDVSKAGGGMLMSTGCHAIEYVRHVFGRAKALRVHAELIESLGLSKPKGVEDVALVTMRFEGDRIGEIHTSCYATGGTDDRAEIYGTKGTIFLDLYRRNEIIVHSHPGYGMLGQSMFSPPPKADRGWSFPIPNEKYDLGYEAELRHFLGCILNDERPSVNFEDGRATLEIMMAAYRSHRTAEVVCLPLSN